MTLYQELFQIAATLVFLASWLLYFRSRRVMLPVPPGPPQDFLLGHLRMLPTTFMWLTYEKWAKIYGDVIYLRALDQGILVISSLDAAKELLEQKSKISSDRPRFTMINELMGWDWALSFQGMGPRFRPYRKAVQSCLHPRVIPVYQDAVVQESAHLLERLLDNPSDKLTQIRQFCGGFIMTLLYGEKPGKRRDEYVANADAAVDGLIEAGHAGKFLVDTLPFLKYVPGWFPGAGFQRKARKWRSNCRKMIEIPYQVARNEYDRHSVHATPSIVKTLLDIHGKAEGRGAADEELIKGTAGVIFLGAADTALSVLYSFIYAMVVHPEVQRRVYEEIKSVVGEDRLPTLEDRPALPYFECVFLEVFRWSPTVPLGLPHRTTEDCNLWQYRIPRGTTILVNQWAILHDEKIYSNPLCFQPERFLKKDGISAAPDPRDASFGFGRRVCPGKAFSDGYLWHIMVQLIAVFTFVKARDANGLTIEPTGEYISGFITRPTEFPFDAFPRSASLEELVRERSSR